jgi:hypothetical protein
VVDRDSRVSIAALFVVDREERGACGRPGVKWRDQGGVERARVVGAGARGVAAAAPDVPNQGSEVEPRGSERRAQGLDVGVRARGVVAGTPSVLNGVPCVSHRVRTVSDDESRLTREGQRVSPRA